MINPIGNERDLDRVLAEVDALLELGRALTVDEQDYLDRLSVEIEKYEEKAYPIAVSNADVIRFMLEMRDVSLAETATGAGIPRVRISDVLAGREKLTAEDAAKLARWFKIEVEVFEL